MYRCIGTPTCTRTYKHRGNAVRHEETCEHAAATRAAADAHFLEQATAAARKDADASGLPQTVWRDLEADGFCTPTFGSACAIVMRPAPTRVPLVTVMPTRYFVGW